MKEFKVDGLVKAGLIINMIWQFPLVFLLGIGLFLSFNFFTIIWFMLFLMMLVLEFRIVNGQASNGVRCFIGILSLVFGILPGIFILCGKYSETE
ncbi:hypothetical protein [Candidatus Phytoplasma fraxini]|uniref:Uncharacterized protein n=1 Tax=Ash yellows phytoplasma TaxID=35780 RepID=A0ABZ2U897_ASHYP